MFRSNSLPINATFPLPPKNEENFAVPRLQSSKAPHPAKLRGRSNSMILKQQQQQQQQQGQMGISGTNLLPALHSTTSEPVLNVGTSALLAQLLTTTSASTLLNMKQHSSSSSAIGSLSPQQSHIAQQQQQKQQSQMCQQVSLGSPISPASSQLQLNQTSSHQQQHSSVLTFAASTSSAGSSGGLSTESMALDLDSPMLGLEGNNSNSSSGSGVGNKFHQQQARSESQRRSGHIHAEQKRRYNIKNGFDMLHSLIPQLQQNPNAKVRVGCYLLNAFEFV